MPRRILLLITDLEIGGTPTVVRELAIRLNDPPGVEVEVACLKGWGPVARQLRDSGIPVTALAAQGASDLLATTWRLARVIRRGSFDTVFSFLMHANAVAALAAPFCPDVRFLQSIQTTQPEPRWHWCVQRLIQAVADTLVVPSLSAARVACDWAGVPASRVVVIPNAVDAASFTRTRLTLVHQDVASAPPGAFHVGFVGRLDPVKRVDVLIAAMSELPPQFNLHIFGDGTERDRLEEQVARSHLQSRVTFHGFVPRVQDALDQIDVLALPSKAEGFGLVLIEAMAAGVPVVAADAPGIRDVVQHDVNGVLSSITGTDLANSIIGLIADPARRTRMVNTARRVVEDRYNWSRVLRQYRALLRIPNDAP